MVFFHFLKTLIVETRLMALLEDINNIIPKTQLFFTFKDIGDETSNFVISRF